MSVIPPYPLPSYTSSLILPPSLSRYQVHVRRAVIAGDMQIVELKGNVSQVRAFARKVTGRESRISVEAGVAAVH